MRLLTSNRPGSPLPMAKNRLPARAAAVLLSGVSLAVLLVAASPALSQTMTLRGNVEDKEPGLLNRRSLSSQSTSLTQSDPDKTKAKEEKAKASKVYLPESDALLAGDDAEAKDEEEALQRTSRLPIGARERGEEMEESAQVRQDVMTRRAARTDDPQDILTGTVRTAPLAADDEERNIRAETLGERAEPIEGLDRRADEDPYAPLGLRLGSFTVTPTLETGLTYSDNVNSSPAKQKGATWETTARLNAVSDWSTHQATINAYGTWRQGVSGPARSEPEAGIDATLRLDMIDSHALTAKAAYSIKREDAESPVPLPAGASRPLLHELEASLALERTDGRLRYGITGALTRNIYGDADLSGMGTLSQKDRNFTLATAKLRLGYEVSPALVPFVEAEYGRRIYDLSLDASGYRRSADRLALRAGAAIDLGEKLTGELAAGMVREKADDPRLAAISGLSLMANLNWSPQRGTTVSLNAETSVEGTTTAGSAGSLLQSGTLAIEHRLLANLTANAQLSASLRNYSGATAGEDLTLAGQLGFTWWLNRNLGVTTRLRHERLTSTLPNRDTATNSVFIGMKWQH